VEGGKREEWEEKRGERGKWAEESIWPPKPRGGERAQAPRG